jgi:hypothetical protein
MPVWFTCRIVLLDILGSLLYDMNLNVDHDFTMCIEVFL